MLGNNYRVQELRRIYTGRNRYYKYKTLETIIEYRYDLTNIDDAYNKINYLAVDYLNSKENIKVLFDGDNLIVKKV